jgi:hypothetical protein
MQEGAGIGKQNGRHASVPCYWGLLVGGDGFKRRFRGHAGACRGA